MLGLHRVTWFVLLIMSFALLNVQWYWAIDGSDEDKILGWPLISRPNRVEVNGVWIYAYPCLLTDRPSTGGGGFSLLALFVDLVIASLIVTCSATTVENLMLGQHDSRCVMRSIFALVSIVGIASSVFLLSRRVNPGLWNAPWSSIDPPVLGSPLPWIGRGNLILWCAPLSSLDGIAHVFTTISLDLGISCIVWTLGWLAPRRACKDSCLHFHKKRP